MDSAERYMRLAERLDSSVTLLYGVQFKVRQCLNHVYASRAMWYMYQGDIKRLKKALRDMHSVARFTPAESYCRLILRDADSNAILFTLGDDDTFYLWYLQFIEGVRPDVIVVNLSLLTTDWYQKVLRDGLGKLVKPLQFEPFGSPLGEWTPWAMAKYEVLSTRLDSHASPIVTKIDKLARNRYAQLFGGSSSDEWSTNAFKLDEDDEDVVSSLATLAMISILEHNKWRRPINVVNTWPFDLFEELTPSMIAQGAINALVPITSPSGSNIISSSDDIAVDTVRLKRYLTESGREFDVISDIIPSWIESSVLLPAIRYLTVKDFRPEALSEILPLIRHHARKDPRSAGGYYFSLVSYLWKKNILKPIIEDLLWMRKHLEVLSADDEDYVENYFRSLLLLSECDKARDFLRNIQATYGEEGREFFSEDPSNLIERYCND